MERGRIAAVLAECGTLLQLKGENPFRANAYQNAARAVLQLEGDPAELAASGELAKVKGIGKTMIEKIVELIQTGELAFHGQLRAEIPNGLIQMLRISGFGPKRIALVHKELGIDSIEGLKGACEDGRLAALKGLGAKTADGILAGIAFLDKTGKRVLHPVALELADRLRSALEGHPAVRRLEVCGSLRRGRDTIKDIDLLVASDDAGAKTIMERFVSAAEVERVVGQGPTKASVLLAEGVPADLRVVTPAQFPFALHYFTGSKAHNVAVRARAGRMDLKLNEYELAGPKGRVDCTDEADIYAALGLDYIEPELREDTGELEAAAEHRLPALVAKADLTGCFHCHTNASDGRATLDEMVAGAKAAGLKYLGIADHSQTASYAGGLKPAQVAEQHAKIDALNAAAAGFRIYKGIESDILPDGSLDYDEATLQQFDYIVASIHMPLAMDEPTMTERVVRAVRHPRCTMLGHPTGRLLLQREAFPIDLETVLRAAAKHNTMIEINANPHRLDLDWVFCKRAKALGVKLVINPDAHSVAGFDHLRFGVATARRGWLEADDIFNTLSPADIATEIRRRRDGAGGSSRS